MTQTLKVMASRSAKRKKRRANLRQRYNSAVEVKGKIDSGLAIASVAATGAALVSSNRRHPGSVRRLKDQKVRLVKTGLQKITKSRDFRRKMALRVAKRLLRFADTQIVTELSEKPATPREIGKQLTTKLINRRKNR